MLKAMLVNSVFHSDEKPHNLVLDFYNGVIDSLNIVVYMIDFGVSTFSFDAIPSGFSMYYAPNDVVDKLR